MASALHWGLFSLKQLFSNYQVQRAKCLQQKYCSYRSTLKRTCNKTFDFTVVLYSYNTEVPKNQNTFVIQECIVLPFQLLMADGSLFHQSS